MVLHSQKNLTSSRQHYTQGYHAQISEAVGHGSQGARKDGSNGAGLGSDVQGGVPISAVLWKLELGGDRGDDQGPDGVPPSGGVMDHGDDGKRGAGREW